VESTRPNVSAVHPAWRAAPFFVVAALWALFTLLAWPASFEHGPGAVSPLQLGDHPNEFVGRHLEYLPTQLSPATFAEAHAHSRDLVASTRDVPAFGVVQGPVWLRLRVHQRDAPETWRLIIEAPWIDHLELYTVDASGVEPAPVVLGDALPYDARPVPGHMFAVDQQFASGQTELWIKAQSVEPLLVPIRVMRLRDAPAYESTQGVFDGLVFGFLVALALYNLMTYVALRKRSQLLYAAYVLSFVLLNLAYTGRAYAWFWPHAPRVQEHAVMLLVLLTSCLLLFFSAEMLQVRERWRPAWRLTLGTAAASAMGVVGIRVTGAYGVLAPFSYSVAGVAVFGSFGFGVHALLRRHVGAGLFLGAASSGLFGSLIGIGVTMGWVPFNDVTARAIELGMLVDATLLTVALGMQLRSTEELRIRAQVEARQDPLTRLGNRRALNEHGERAWESAAPLSVIVLDIDHFKRVNDRYGHATGDLALCAVARLLKGALRGSDFSARAGGEEFVVLLEETNLEQAQLLAERLRKSIEDMTLQSERETLRITASFGVYARDEATASFSAFIAEADRRLYVAKERGRNRVVSGDA
jgi:diguanylate cyclase (GGDEF)-like protein